MSKFLVVYYSFSGATRTFANEIARLTKGDVRELIPQRPYDFSYNTASKEVRNEIARGYCPKLIAGNEPLDAYEIILVGTPNWFRSMAPPLLSFFRSHDFSNKVVVPFCTHGGGGFGTIEQKVAEECQGAIIRPGLAAMGTLPPEKIENWLKTIELI